MYFQHMRISRRQVEQLQRPEQLRRGGPQPGALLLNLVPAPNCLGKVLHVAYEYQNVLLSVFLKRCRVAETRHIEMGTSCYFSKYSPLSFLLSRSAVPQCCSRGMSKNVSTLLHTPFTVFYMLAQVMHVIDCSHWPETSTRLTSAGNYWPPLIVSQCCRGVYVCVCTSVCHIFTIIGFSHLFLVVPDTADKLLIFAVKFACKITTMVSTAFVFKCDFFGSITRKGNFESALQILLQIIGRHI